MKKKKKTKRKQGGSGADPFQNELAAMKEKLLTGEKFSDIHNFFFDHLGENDFFMKRCKRAKNPQLTATITAAAKQVFQREVTITGMMLLKYPKFSFYHGSCFIEKKVAGMFFFEDINMGMLSVVRNYPETSFVRFSLIPLTEDMDKDEIFISPIKSKAIH